jgi:hypothetical protein
MMTDFVMGVDPTVKLGDFSLTPIVYQHLLVRDKNSSKSPWLLGPVLIHYKKEFRNYNFFFSTLVRLSKCIAKVKAIGTDGEHNLIEAAQQQFKEAVHLRCFRHLPTNIEHHLHSKQVSAANIRMFIQEIFGWTDIERIHKDGLLDCNSAEDFMQCYLS